MKLKPYGQQTAQRKVNNAKSLAAFGVNASYSDNGSHLRTIRQGNGVTVFTIGYEKRSGDELIALLLDAGVELLADVREKPMSRKPDFRGSSLRARCQEANLGYQHIPELGSTENQRKMLRETHDIKTFQRRFRTYAKRYLDEPIDRLTEVVKTKSVALLCYERSHDDCHRSAVADFVADRIGAGIVAII